MNNAEKLKLEAKLRRVAPLMVKLSNSSALLSDRARTALNRVLDEKLPLIRELTEKQMEALLLKLVAEQPADGFELVNNLTKAHFRLLGAEEGAIYGILSRLEEKGFLEGRWREVVRMKKVYHLTDKGNRRLGRKSALAGDVALWADRVLGPNV